YLKYYSAIKATNPDAQVGVILCIASWDKAVMNIIKDKLDFAVIHLYPGSEISQNKILRSPAKEIFQQILEVSVPDSEDYLNQAQTLLKETTGRDIPIAVTEYNAGLTSDHPVPFRHALGTALVNAELLRVFMKPEHHILMANYWQFSNSFWGMVYTNGDFMQHGYAEKLNYIKRPNYYVYELYARHFGGTLLNAVSEGRSLSVNASKDKAENKIYLAVLNKDMEQDVECTVNLNDFSPTGEVVAYILSGKNIDSLDADVKETAYEIEGNSFIFTFPRHSLVFLEIKGKKL
ncbi:MAG: alpha-L-arabinofuranosidase C-terminal domain-containing protein, partial [Candidatus Omnitrophica bacterium]|nr:alpha-L-arabinofuranosidase C-terminal domain-containing protein [Candidatus Omnitrophota bacterium]